MAAGEAALDGGEADLPEQRVPEQQSPGRPASTDQPDRRGERGDLDGEEDGDEQQPAGGDLGVLVDQREVHGAVARHGGEQADHHGGGEHGYGCPGPGDLLGEHR